VIVTCGVIIGILFLEETHAEKKFRRDPGLEVGRWIISKGTGCPDSNASRQDNLVDLGETISLTQGGPPPGYRSTEGSPKFPSTPSPEAQDLLDLNNTSVAIVREKPAVTKAFTRQVMFNIIGYGILA
jgi:hypothetical protein